MPFSLALLDWDTGLREEAAGPGPGLPVQVGTAGLSSSLLGSGQAQDEVVPSLLSGWLLASLSGLSASACPSGEEKKRHIYTNVKHTRWAGRAQPKW